MTFEVLVKWRGPYLTVPMKRTGSWGMTDSLLLKSSRPMRAMSTPSMMIDPRLSSASLKSATPSEDFPEETTHLCHNLFPPPTQTTSDRQTGVPEPVLPTIPTVSSGSTLKDRFFRTRGRSSRYRISTFWKEIRPSSGQLEAEAEEPQICRGPSLSRFWVNNDYLHYYEWKRIRNLNVWGFWCHSLLVSCTK